MRDVRQHVRDVAVPRVSAVWGDGVRRLLVARRWAVRGVREGGGDVSETSWKPNESDIDTALKVLQYFRVQARERDERSVAQHYADAINRLQDEVTP